MRSKLIPTNTFPSFPQGFPQTFRIGPVFSLLAARSLWKTRSLGKRSRLTRPCFTISLGKSGISLGKRHRAETENPRLLGARNEKPQTYLAAFSTDFSDKSGETTLHPQLVVTHQLVMTSGMFFTTDLWREVCGKRGGCGKFSAQRSKKPFPQTYLEFSRVKRRRYPHSTARVSVKRLHFPQTYLQTLWKSRALSLERSLLFLDR